MLFDTHCHYNLPTLSHDPLAHWQKAQTVGVTKTVIVGTTVETSQGAVQLSSQLSSWVAAIGLHPHVATDLVAAHDDNGIADFEHLHESAMKTMYKQFADISQLAGHPTVKALGETGLDYFHLPNQGPEREIIIKLQLASLQLHIELAQELQKPLIIHVRDKGEQAYWNVLTILQKTPPTIPFILHCISGPTSYVQAAISLGGFIGVAGNITYRSSEHLRELVKLVPKDRVLLETDAPYLPPQPHRGQTCEPWMVKLTAEFISNQLGISFNQLYENAESIFS